MTKTPRERLARLLDDSESERKFSAELREPADALRLERDLEAKARREGRGEADIIRDALTQDLRRTKTAKDMRFGAFASGHADTSERVDEILEEAGFGRS